MPNRLPSTIGREQESSCKKHGKIPTFAFVGEEFHDAGIAENFDDFVRGWLGYNSRQYRHGIIHFAPNICEATFDQGFDTLTAFAAQLRIDGKTKILNFVKYGEQTMGDLLPNRF